MNQNIEFKKQECLADLKLVKERRKGKKLNILFQVVLCSAGMGFSGYFIAGLGLPAAINIPLVLLPILFLPLMIWLSTREVSLITQNYALDIASGLAEYLKEDEQVIAVLSGKGYSMKAPAWINDDVYPGTLFLFTTHRLLVVTLKRSRIGMGSLEKIIHQDDFESAINTVHSCDYNDRDSVQLSSILPNVLASLAYSKLKTKPVGEDEPYTWALSNKSTEAGRITKTIMSKFSTDLSA